VEGVQRRGMPVDWGAGGVYSTSTAECGGAAAPI